jgi:hypothetical protein
VLGLEETALMFINGLACEFIVHLKDAC